MVCAPPPLLLALLPPPRNVHSYDALALVLTVPSAWDILEAPSVLISSPNASPATLRETVIPTPTPGHSHPHIPFCFSPKHLYVSETRGTYLFLGLASLSAQCEVHKDRDFLRSAHCIPIV